VTRREILLSLGAAALGAALPRSLAAQPSSSAKRLVVILLRGGLDALSVTPPVGDPRYYCLRPSIALAPPGNANAALYLTGIFGIHPALQPILDLWNQGKVALIQGVGLPEAVRTHPEAQRAAESGLPQERSPHDGWMGRLLGQLEPGAKAISVASKPTLITQGRLKAESITPVGYPSPPWRIDRPEFFAPLDQIYHGQDQISRAYHQSQAVLKNKLSELEKEIKASSAEAPSVQALPELGVKIASYLDNNPATRLVFLGLGGFDTHFDQGGGKGWLAEALFSLGRGVAALVKALEEKSPDTVVLIYSEFGRSAVENDFLGTDNGRAGLALVAGGPTAGGRMYGTWPGLTPDKLEDGKDLTVTVDYREVIATVAQAHLGLGQEALAQVLPGYAMTGKLDGLIRKS
jgi:uncharacterized protein (DUF1501 family)